MDRNELAHAIKDAAYLEGDFILSSGQRSKYYLDKYLFSTDPVLLKEIARRFAAILPERYDVVAGLELGAIPLATALALEVQKPYVIVRKAAKEYGTSKLFEGTLEPGWKVVLVEDVLTTASQAIDAAKRLTDFGVDVVKVVYVIDREQGAAQNLAAAGLDAEALFTKTDLGI
jgi:orotate phosphoribosyltransferase